MAFSTVAEIVGITKEELGEGGESSLLRLMTELLVGVSGLPSCSPIG